MKKIPDRIDSKFRYVLLAAERAEQMMRGAPRKVDEGAKLSRVALEEISDGLVEWDYGPPPEPAADEEAAGEAEGD